MDSFDAVVIGTGAGGGSVGYKLAKEGKKVLFIERGRELTDKGLGRSEEAMLIQKAASPPALQVNGEQEKLFVGGVAGGSTSIYGAALMRPSEEDFTPGKYYSRFLSKSLWEWPLTYADFEPYYAEVESLFKISGETEKKFPFVKQASRLKAPLPLKPVNEMLSKHFESEGLHPFSLPLSINQMDCEECAGCPGYLCPTEARGSSLNRLIKPAIDKYGATLWTESEVLQINMRRKDKVAYLRVRRKNEGREVAVKAKVYVVSGGAVGSPALLLKTDIQDQSQMIGKNFMFHLGVVFYLYLRDYRDASESFHKQLGITDYYLSPRGEKLGYIQQLPIPGRLTMRNESPFPVPSFVTNHLFNHGMLFAGAIEDLPRQENNVSYRPSGGLSIRHDFHAYDIERGKTMKDLFLPHLKSIHRSFALGNVMKDESLHTAHQVGTCRFGVDAKSSVLDPNCRMHHVENLYVVDGSFMPTSLGVGPGLTIMANGLRVGDHLIKDVL